MRALFLAWILFAQDEAKIEFSYEPNVAWKFESTYKATGKIKIEQGGKTEEWSDLFENEEAAWTETALEVKDGVPSKKEIEYSKAAFERKDLGDKEKVTGAKSFQGKKMTLIDAGGPRTQFEIPAGVDKKDLRDLRIRNDAMYKSLPKAPIRVGHKWTADGRDVLRDANDHDGDIEYTSGSTTYAFLRMEDRKGDKCAVIEAKTELTGKGENAMKMTVKVETLYYISLEKKFPVEISGRATYEYKGGGADVGYTLQGSGGFETLTKVSKK